jgi:hypothetical protein
MAGTHHPHRIERLVLCNAAAKLGTPEFDIRGQIPINPTATKTEMGKNTNRA